MGCEQGVRHVQKKILEIMKYIDRLCRDHGIVYFIMGGTALGAIRHGGFIPWDDDLDIFMTPDQYIAFKAVFEEQNSETFILQEWKTVPDYLEYAKIRMNGTAFIEHQFRNYTDLHQGIYVDIMILHKVPDSWFIQKLVYYECKFVTLYGLSQRNWKPKTKVQAVTLSLLKILPRFLMATFCYRQIYRYDNMRSGFLYCYWITPAKFRNGLFEESFFANPVDIRFEDTILLGSAKIKDYLANRYDNYMQLPSEAKREAAVHAEIFDCNRDYREVLKDAR